MKASPCPIAASLLSLAFATALPGLVCAQSGPGNSLQIAGTINYVAVPHTASFNAMPITVMAWVNTSVTSGQQGLVNKYAANSLSGWNLFLLDGRVRAWYFVNSTRNVYGGGDGLDGGFIADGLWHHIALIVDSSGAVILIDGVQTASRAWTGAFGATTTAQEVRIGSYPGGNNGFIGSIFIDDVSVWNASLGFTQIRASRNGGTTPLDANLLAYYLCDESGGTTVADSAPLGGSNNGTFVGLSLFPRVAPSAETLAGVAESVSQARLSANAYPNRSTIDAGFQWGTTTNLGNTTMALTGIGGPGANLPQQYSLVLSGLAPDTTYHYRAFASNSQYTDFGNKQTLHTFNLVDTLPASAVTEAAATLNGVATPGGVSASGWFEWGLSTNHGNVTPAQALGSTGTTNFSQTLTGLPFGTVFHFRAVGSNNFGIDYGSDQTFRTIGPSVETLPASDLTQTSALLNGVANPDGQSAMGWFEWGFSTNYGSVTAPQSVGSGGRHTNFSHALSGLIPSVTYHFRAIASNSFGVAFGVDDFFPRLTQVAYLKASNTDADDFFSRSVAIDGDTLVIGARAEDGNATGVNGDGSNNTGTNSGAAYVFVHNGSSWVQQAYLKANNTGNGDSFGTSVAISGDTIVVGAPLEDSNATGVNGNGSNNTGTNSGAAYVFVRSGTNWTQQAYLKASNTETQDEFGETVAISGNTLLVGASGEDSNATGVNGNQSDNSLANAGAAYVFVRNGTTWSQQAYLKSADPDQGGAVNGVAVAVSGDTALLGFSGEIGGGAAYVFVRNGTTWSQQAEIAGSNTQPIDIFGVSVGLDGDTAVVGAAFEDSTATGVNGSGTDPDLSFNSGAAYVFVRSGTNWSQQAYLKASNTGADDRFGGSVALRGDTVVIGATSEDSLATGVNGDGANNSSAGSGAAYVFTRSGPNWTFQYYLKASNTGINDGFGGSVAVSGDFVVVGAEFEDSNAVGVNGDQSNNSANSSGAAYVFGPPGPAAPEIDVFHSGTNLLNGASVPQIISAVSNSTIRNFSIQNTGSDFLTGLTVTFTGPDADAFSVAFSPVAPLLPKSISTLIVRFAPTNPGTNTATLRIASNDADENPFDIQLSGVSLSFIEDQDGDGLNDASEFLMASFGFNFQASQTNLVNTLFNNVGGAVPNLNAIGYFTQSQLQVLNVGAPLLTHDPLTGLFTLTIGVEKATLLTNFFPFPMTAPQTTINAEGKLEFQFSAPDGATFFRLEAR